MGFRKSVKAHLRYQKVKLELEVSLMHVILEYLITNADLKWLCLLTISACMIKVAVNLAYYALTPA